MTPAASALDDAESRAASRPLPLTQLIDGGPVSNDGLLILWVEFDAMSVTRQTAAKLGERKGLSRVRRQTMGSRRSRFVNGQSTGETGRCVSEKCRSCGGTRLVSALQHRDASLKRVKR